MVRKTSCCKTMARLLNSVLVFSLYLLVVRGDYECVCNYNVEQSVLPNPDLSAQPLGYLYEFDCKPQAKTDGLDSNTWLALAFEHQLGYVQMNAQIQVQICPGTIPDYDILTTTTTPSTTTIATTPKPTTIKITTPKPTTERITTIKTTPKPTTTTTLSTTITTTPEPTTSVRSQTTTTPKPKTTVRETTTPRPITSTFTITTTKPITAVRTTTLTTLPPKVTTTLKTTKPTTTTFPNTTPELTTTTTTSRPTISSMTTTTMKTTTTTKLSTMKPATNTKKSTTDSTTPVTAIDPVVGNIDLCPVEVQHISEQASSQLGQFNSSCYELIMAYNDTWINAESKCVVRGGHLADIADKGEQLFLTRFLQRFSPHHAVWIGLNDRKVEGNFVWTSGILASYYNWYSGHSDHFLSHLIEDCTVFIPYQNGRWDDLPCQLYHNKPVHYPTLCEYKISR